jgi:hypothetical protein
MRKLKEQFIGIGEVKGFDFFQLNRTENAAFYKVENSYYEIFIIKTQKEQKKNINGSEVFFKPKEIYPRSNQFGISAWTIHNYDKALTKWGEISKTEQ